MFTGIIEETGVVDEVESSANGVRFTVRTGVCGRGLKVGDSLAVNGCCLTVAALRTREGRRIARFDLLRETWQRTNLQFAEPGAAVNLERSLRASDRIGGHFVTGHIDGVGTIRRWEQKGADWLLDIEAPDGIIRYVISKGSIAVDGISLTVAAVRRNRFQVWIIPHTYKVTALRERKRGDVVNIEPDILGKYVEQFMKAPEQRR